MRGVLVVAAMALGLASAAAQENYASWPALKNPFPSTGGGGIMIGGYAPVIAGTVCTTDFTATTPEGAVYYNSVEFDAVATDSGVLCTNGRWKSKDGSASGTTPFRVFLRDGVWRMPPG